MNHERSVSDGLHALVKLLPILPKSGRISSNLRHRLSKLVSEAKLPDCQSLSSTPQLCFLWGFVIGLFSGMFCEVGLGFKVSGISVILEKLVGVLG